MKLFLRKLGRLKCLKTKPGRQTYCGWYHSSEHIENSIQLGQCSHVPSTGCCGASSMCTKGDKIVHMCPAGQWQLRSVQHVCVQ